MSDQQSQPILSDALKSAQQLLSDLEQNFDKMSVFAVKNQLASVEEQMTSAGKAQSTSSGNDALKSAQQLLSDLRQNFDKLSVIALKGQLVALAEQLTAAGKAQSTSSISADPTTPVPDLAANTDLVEALRGEITQLIDRSASFNSLMVHEIRKPMTAIRGYADMLAKPGMIGPMNPMQQQFIDTIRTNIIRMEGLVSDISDINKLTSGRMKLDPKMNTFSQVILDVQKQSEALIAEYTHTVTWDIPQGLPLLNTDSKQLAKVIVHLLKNAIYYTPKGGTITVSAKPTDGNALTLSIKDSGIGMKPEEIARLGEPFYRADHELVTSTKGYGLGIPVSMGFLKLMGSELKVESSLGQGSTVSFSLAGMA